jgi:hypothetical protein
LREPPPNEPEKGGTEPSGTHRAQPQSMDTPRSDTASGDALRLSELARVAARHAAQLLSAEIALAKDDVRSELQNAKSRAIGLAISALLLEAAIVLLALGFILLFGVSAPIVFATGMALASLSLIVSFYGTRPSRSHAIPTMPERFDGDAKGT